MVARLARLLVFGGCAGIGGFALAALGWFLFAI
jgi:hypothetical protein